ncbi:putative inactive beta-glucosidase 14 [Drosera capensis]
MVANSLLLVLPFLALVPGLAESITIQQIKNERDSSRFPVGFLFGTASAAYQYEGAYKADGKGLSNWDVFTHSSGTHVEDGTTGDVATDHYHCYQEDVELMAALGVNSYRFSISWARILPKGRYGEVNLAGIEFYNNLIDALLEKEIQPFVTLCHYDIPQELEDRYGGWLSPLFKKDFKHYADICFKYFGDRVKYWATFNEPNVVAIYSYGQGKFPPCRCSGSFGNCTEGDSETEPYLAAHQLILAHAAAVDLYRKEYQKDQRGSIGIVLHSVWYEPLRNTSEDELAAKRAIAFFLDWFLLPIMTGSYPMEMKGILGSTLPDFSKKEQKVLNKALDFIGINHYTSYYAKDCMFSKCERARGVTETEGLYQRNTRKNGVPIGEPTALDWLYVYPQGMESMVTYVKDRYNNTPIFITENGYVQDSSTNPSTIDLLRDFKRVEYMNDYLGALRRAMRKGGDVRGYFAWSLLDNFEWNHGYTKRFGLYHVDYATLKRTPKYSTTWYKRYLAKHMTEQTYVAT